MLDNTIWNALTTEHAHLAIRQGNACRYPADIAPFAGVGEASEAALYDLRELLQPGEQLWVAVDELPQIEGLTIRQEQTIWQMILPPMEVEAAAEAAAEGIVLTGDHSEAMVNLTARAFPGYFRPRTYLLGSYYGVFDTEDHSLIAMAGERFAVPGWTEISGVCTHPDHTGQGYAGRLMRRLMANHAKRGQRSFLHVSEGNSRAIAIYHRLGFAFRRSVRIHLVERGVRDADYGISITDACQKAALCD